MTKRFHRFFEHHTKATLSIGVLVAVNLAFALILWCPSFTNYPEVDKLAYNRYSFKELVTYFDDLAREKGAVYAFEILKRAHIPPNTDIHLLAHGIGDILFDEKGAEGILDCTQDFRNACSHQIVINTLVEKGPSSFLEIADICKRAPGGKNGYSMCYHGLGHGVLAYNGYDLGRALTMCGQSGPAKGEEDVQCGGGALMEMMAGVHDPEIWRSQSKKYFKKEDPLAPCNSSVVPTHAKSICYIYLTPHLFEAGGQIPGTKPNPESLRKAMSFCAKLGGTDRRSCYGGFGKEYAPMAHSKDIRNIQSMTDAGLGTALYWCTLAGVKDGTDACVAEAVRSIYWAGDVDPAIAIRFCVLAETWGYGEPCASAFVGSVEANIADSSYRTMVCDSLPSKHRKMCASKLL